MVQFFRDNFKQKLRFELPFLPLFSNIVLVLDYEVVNGLGHYIEDYTLV
jgi:hypothetical protein